MTLLVIDVDLIYFKVSTLIINRTALNIVDICNYIHE